MDETKSVVSRVKVGRGGGGRKKRKALLEPACSRKFSVFSKHAYRGECWMCWCGRRMTFATSANKPWTTPTCTGVDGAFFVLPQLLHCAADLPRGDGSYLVGQT